MGLQVITFRRRKVDPKFSNDPIIQKLFVGCLKNVFKSDVQYIPDENGRKQANYGSEDVKAGKLLRVFEHRRKTRYTRLISDR